MHPLFHAFVSLCGILITVCAFLGSQSIVPGMERLAVPILAFTGAFGLVVAFAFALFACDGRRGD